MKCVRDDVWVVTSWNILWFTKSTAGFYGTGMRGGGD